MGPWGFSDAMMLSTNQIVVIINSLVEQNAFYECTAQIKPSQAQVTINSHVKISGLPHVVSVAAADGPELI